VPHDGAACFLVIATVIVGYVCNPLRTLLAPLLVTLSTLLGVLHNDVRRRLLVAAWDHLPAAWGRVKFGRLIAGDVLGGDAAQLLGGVAENVIQNLERRW
jgi:hypothetical protein